MRIASRPVRPSSEPVVPEERGESPGPGEVIVRVAGCGVCRTDLGFFLGEVPRRHPFPRALGHEISGRVEEAGAGAEA